MGIRHFFLPVLAAASLSACYHQTVQTAPAPAGARVIDKPWQMSFAYGLVPPPEVNAAEECQGGVARVETEHSFLNSLVAVVTFGIVTPMRVIITCAGGSSSADHETIEAGDTDEARAAALEQAIQLARHTGAAFVRY